MSACAGSSIDASRSMRLGCRRKGLILAQLWNDRGIARNRKRRIFKHFAGPVWMDRARQDRVHEYAETGRPFAARTLQGARGQFGRQIPRFSVAKPPSNCRRSNGPAGDSGNGGHKLSAIGLPQTTDRLVRFVPIPSRFAACEAGRRTETVPQALPWLSAHPLPAAASRLHPALPHVPAALSCRTERYDGKGNLHLQHAA
jgi:hypothetical protein